jgi:hypothetical protein
MPSAQYAAACHDRYLCYVDELLVYTLRARGVVSGDSRCLPCMVFGLVCVDVLGIGSVFPILLVPGFRG